MAIRAWPGLLPVARRARDPRWLPKIRRRTRSRCELPSRHQHLHPVPQRKGRAGVADKLRAPISRRGKALQRGEGGTPVRGAVQPKGGSESRPSGSFLRGVRILAVRRRRGGTIRVAQGPATAKLHPSAQRHDDCRDCVLDGQHACHAHRGLRQIAGLRLAIGDSSPERAADEHRPRRCERLFQSFTSDAVSRTVRPGTPMPSRALRSRGPAVRSAGSAPGLD